MPRMSASERREDVIRAALADFAVHGYSGTSTERIARAAGISHAYLFRLFGTKRDLFVACAEHTRDRFVEAFRSAAAEAPEGERLAAMGSAYVQLLEDREVLRNQVQMWAACAADPELAAVGRRQYGEVWQEIERLSGADDDTVRAFVSHGMLLSVAASLGLSDDAHEPWVQRALPHLAEVAADREQLVG